MKITVKYLGFLSSFTKTAKETIEFNVTEPNIFSLIAALDDIHDNTFRTHVLDKKSNTLKMQVLVNGEAAGLYTVVKGGDEVVFFMPMFGG
jgi:molybdopterin converting factor small subunit